MNRTAAELIELTGKPRLLRLGVLTTIVAACEAAGFLLLVPLLERMDAGAGAAPSAISRTLESWGLTPGIGAMLALFVVLVCVRVVADYMRSMQMLEATISVVDGLRARAFGALVEAEWRLLSKMHQGENRALLITTINNVAAAIEIFFTLAKTALSLGAIAIAALVIAPLFALGSVVAGVLVLASYSRLRRRAHDLGEALVDRHRSIHALLEENLDSLRLIKSFGKERAAREAVSEGFTAMRGVQREYLRDTGRARVMLQGGAALLLALLVYAALSWGDVRPAILLPLVALFGRAVPQLSALQDGWQQWANTAPSLVAARKLIAEAERFAEPPLATIPDPPRLSREIRLERVSFRHRPDIPALDRVDLAIPARSMSALVGESGAGKSTLADLLAGLLTPDEGRVTIDGRELDPPHRRAWRSRVAYVQQDPLLFAGTIRDNLAWASPDASEERCNEVLELASAGFVFDLPDGIHHRLGERGRQLSGGERQRIVLARALLRDPDLLILDEATSALDPASDEAVAAAVARLKGSRTILIIGHRGALTDIAERRITLSHGRLIGDQPSR